MKFELNSLPRNCSDEEIIAEIKRVDSIVNKELLTKKEYDKYGKMTSGRIQKRFGGWEKALIAAGLEHKYSGRSVSEKMRSQKAKYLTNEQVLEEIQSVARILNRNSITTEDLRINSESISEAIIRRRFGSWEAGMEKAGLKVSENYRRRFSDEEYFENLLHVWTHYGHQPLLRELNEAPSEISSSAYENHFGGWRKALEAFVERMNREDNETEQALKSNKHEELNPETKKQTITVADRRSIGLGLRYKALNRDKFKCVKCGSSPAINHNCQLQIDHIVPFSKGGKTILENLQTLCENCNLGKGNRHSD